jgi:hypothetical protein
MLDGVRGSGKFMGPQGKICGSSGGESMCRAEVECDSSVPALLVMKNGALVEVVVFAQFLKSRSDQALGIYLVWSSFQSN